MVTWIRNKVVHNGKEVCRFVPVMNNKYREKLHVVPRVAVKRDGTVTINNTFFKDIGVNPNNNIMFEYDEEIGLLRFKLVEESSPQTIELISGSFKIPKDNAEHLLWASNQIAWKTASLAYTNCDFVIVRKDAGDWYYAKASGYRYGINRPKQLEFRSKEDNEFWDLPDDFFPKEQKEEEEV